MDMMQAIAIRSANSMKHFAGSDETFCLGDWRAWEAACITEGRTIPPAEFKALPKEKRREYLVRPNVEFSGGAPLYGAASAGTQGYACDDKGERI